MAQWLESSPRTKEAWVRIVDQAGVVSVSRGFYPGSPNFFRPQKLAILHLRGILHYKFLLFDFI